MPKTLRHRILALRDRMPVQKRALFSLQAIQHLSTLPAFETCRLPLIYVSFRSEVDTHQLIRDRLAQGSPVAVPRTDLKNHRLGLYLLENWDRDLAPGAYGIPEPVPERCKSLTPDKIDLVVVPGSVFDARCGRYGYGGGYYDWFLEKEASHAVRVGLAFQIQRLEEIPLEPHDQRMDWVVTETGTLRCAERKGLR